MPDLTELRSAFQARTDDGVVNLAGYETEDTPFVDSKSDAKSELKGRLQRELFDSHELLFAEKKDSVLLVLQGLDCSGKNGTIKHVVIAMNPAGVRTASFTEPTKEELEHHFLWRYRCHAPPPGHLTVFDRSHYEDVVVPMAHGSLDEAQIAERIDEINAFEAEMVDSGTTIIKCFLHISYDEQRERFLRRLRRDDKRWKFAESDLAARRMWNEFQAAYGNALAATSTDHAPWFIVPADRKWYRNWAIAQLFLATIADMAPTYPQPALNLDALRKSLEPPN